MFVTHKFQFFQPAQKRHFSRIYPSCGWFGCHDWYACTQYFSGNEVATPVSNLTFYDDMKG